MKLTSIKALFIILITITFGCSSEKEVEKSIPQIPQLTTTTATNITLTAASVGGNITVDGGAPVTSRGVVWNNATAPTISLATKTTDGSGTGSFTSAISNLNPSTNYYARAYATNSIGIAYGNEITFTTGAIVLPTLTTNVASSITYNSAVSGGAITADGGGTITERGVVWSTSTSPTITLSTKTTDGTGTGNFSSAISNLIPSTKYYIRSYATNSAGTSYGNEISFSTSVLPIETVVIGDQTWALKNLDVETYNDGTPIPQVTDDVTWRSLTTGAWCYYNNDPQNGPTYGKLYNWYAVEGIWDEASKTDVSKRKKLAPVGYSIPYDGGWDGLARNLGGKVVAGGKLKETGIAHWKSPNTQATNSSGFTALPGGFRNSYGPFEQINEYSVWWSYFGYLINDSIYPNWGISYNNGAFYRIVNSKLNGYSVRIMKN